MANFKTHLTAGIIGSISAVTICYKYEIFTNIFDILFAGILGIAGSILPDIDAEQSIPTRITFSILAFASVGLLLANYHYQSEQIHIGALVGGCVIAYFTTKFLFPKILSRITHHRGLIHSVPMAILLSLGLMSILINHGYEKNLALLFGSFLGGGFLLHLILDELYSVDIIGTRLKSSFGTALQFFSFAQPLRYLALYGLIGYMYFDFLGERFIALGGV